MKKLALGFVLLSAPVFACPHQDAAQKTAQKTDDGKSTPAKKDDTAKKSTDQAKAKQPEPAKKPG